MLDFSIVKEKPVWVIWLQDEFTGHRTIHSVCRLEATACNVLKTIQHLNSYSGSYIAQEISFVVGDITYAPATIVQPSEYDFELQKEIDDKNALIERKKQLERNMLERGFTQEDLILLKSQ
jgi:hypothetical protein